MIFELRGEKSILYYIFESKKIKSLKDSNFDLAEKRDEFNALRMGSWYKAASGNERAFTKKKNNNFFIFIFFSVFEGIYICGKGIMELRINSELADRFVPQNLYKFWQFIIPHLIRKKKLIIIITKYRN